ncbi:Glutamyl-tRNA(Gln) amidotransferase subunit A [Chlamydiales bacterium SCGC AB-751-O23]|jgi:aspartyl-tRNA(Asn)/glutamyl-tRNA(Gln) amidotransferase subunit A|nr:Glutamyl-tRNA(Gln) amidotransferase subunit A [Chlamydiales bacterium SCGC AB-751-O23]
MLNKSARQLHIEFTQGKLTAEEIIRFYLDRIKKHNENLGAFLSVFENEAIEKAKALDVKKAQGAPLGKLAAIPIAVKDNILVKGHKSTCGSKMLENYVAPYSGSFIQEIEKEDAIIIGKTNLDQFGMGSSNENSIFGPSLNPWNLKCSPGGSSGGSASAVAARLVPIALGTDTGGSVRQPASFCGTYGFKPTYGRTSRFGVIAFGSSLDQIGTFANYAEDISLIMEVAGKHCPHDATSLPIPKENYLDKSVDFKNLKIGIPQHFIDNLPAETKEVFKKSIEQAREAGAQIVDVSLKLIDYAIAVYYILSTAEASTNLARFDGIRYGHRSTEAKNLKDIYRLSRKEGFGTEVKRRILLGTFVLSAGYKDAFYKKAQKVRKLIIEEFKTAFKDCDLIALPTSLTPAFEIGSIVDPLTMYKSDSCTISTNLAGLPAISCPAGFSKDNKPMGIQFLGPQTHDAFVCQAAQAFEKINSSHAQIPSLV